MSEFLAARNAQEGKEDDGDFFSFLKVEQDIDLSPEEYQIALDAEREGQRKKFYIGGVVKKNNLIVPWRDVDEDELEKMAREALRKNGIYDPSRPRDEEEDTKVTMSIIGETDVRLDWEGGTPGEKVGYIVEKKRQNSADFKEIANYEEFKNTALLAKTFAGNKYDFTDEYVKPGPWTYRVLVRFRSGEVKVVDQLDVDVPEPSGIDIKVSYAVLLLTLGGLIIPGLIDSGAPVFD